MVNLAERTTVPVTLDAATLADLARLALGRFQAADAEDTRALNEHLTARSGRESALRVFAGLAQALEVQLIEHSDAAPFTREELDSVGSDDGDLPPAGCQKLWRMACAAAIPSRRY